MMTMIAVCPALGPASRASVDSRGSLDSIVRPLSGQPARHLGEGERAKSRVGRELAGCPYGEGSAARRAGDAQSIDIIELVHIDELSN